LSDVQKSSKEDPPIVHIVDVKVVNERLHVREGVAAVGAVAYNGIMLAEPVLLNNSYGFLALE
jgi:hypothetical protein